MAKEINGKLISQNLKDKVKVEVAKLNEQGIFPSLAVIIVGNDPASRVYVNNKKKACEYTGIKSVEYALPEDTSEKELLQLIEKFIFRKMFGVIFYRVFTHHAFIHAFDKLSDVCR